MVGFWVSGRRSLTFHYIFMRQESELALWPLLIRALIPFMRQESELALWPLLIRVLIPFMTALSS